MSKFFLAFLLYPLTAIPTYGQNFEWAKGFGSPAYYVQDIGKAVAYDLNGNVYVSGYFNDTLEIDSGSVNPPLISKGGHEVFIIKLDKTGQLLWAKSFGGPLLDECFSIAVDKQGNVYMAGAFQGTADFDPGNTNWFLTSKGGYDAFVSKLNGNGDFLGAISFGSIGHDVALSIKVDDQNNTYTSGFFSDTCDFNPGFGIFEMKPKSPYDLFIQKMGPSANFIWAKQIEGTGYDDYASLALDRDANIYLTGNFRLTADFDPSMDTAFLHTPSSHEDAFVLKLDKDGDFKWVRQISGLNTVMARGIALDPSGNVYITGSFNGLVDFDPGQGVYSMNATGYNDPNAYICKLNHSGNFVWARQINGFYSGSPSHGIAIEVDQQENVYTLGQYNFKCDFDPGTDTLYFRSKGFSDVFINKLDSYGNLIWNLSLGGKSGDEGKSMAVDTEGNIYTTGVFDDVVDFDPGNDVYNLHSKGFGDVYVNKLSQPGFGISESYNHENPNIYPNPTDGFILVDLGAVFSEVSVEIYTSCGQLVSTKRFNTLNQINLLIEGHPGLYYLKIETEDKIFTGLKVIKL